MGTTNTEKIEHSTLGFEDSTTTDGSDFYTRHRDRDLKMALAGSIGQCMLD